MTIHNPAVRYRPEIDGLRAIAVLPVIFFHAGMQVFSGGFVGVDVFFVISGYLITLILIRELQAGRFSITGFYERRARRILPALIVVCLCSLAAAWMVLLPGELVRFGKSLLSVALFGSNIHFWRSQDYFASATEDNPLLHTWSLAVEEQFYFLFPVFLFVVWRFGRRATATWIVCATLISLALSEWGVRHEPAATFYLLPTRGWELAAGSIVALWHSKPGAESPAKGTRHSEVLGVVGIALIAFPIFKYSNTTAFPGLHAVPPVLGTVLVIAFTTHKHWVGRLLASKPLVGMGLISYSAYLWHFPLFAFAKIYSPVTLGPTAMMGLVVLTIVLSYLTWRFVEVPARTSDLSWLKGRRALPVLLGSFMVVGIAGGAVAQSQGVPGRYTSEEREWIHKSEQGYQTTLQVYGLRSCFLDYDQTVEALFQNDCLADIGKPSLVVFGDSAAAHLTSEARRVAAKLGLGFIEFTATSCRPFPYGSNVPRCRDFYDRFVSDVLPKLQPDSRLVVSAFYHGTYVDYGEAILREAMAVSLKTLSARKDIDLTVLGQSPILPKHPIATLIRNGDYREPTATMDAAPAEDITAVLKKVTEQAGVTFIDPMPAFCSAGNRCLVRESGQMLYIDGGHLSEHGARKIWRLVPWTRSALATLQP